MAGGSPSLRLEPGRLRLPGGDRRPLRPRPGGRAGNRPPRRRRLRLEGLAAAAGRPRRDGGAGGRAAGSARRHAAADVRVHRLPHAHDPAAPARRRPRWAPDGDRARRRRADLDGGGVRRAERGRDADDVRVCEPPDNAPPRAPRRADALVDARAGRVSGDVRARGSDRRARGCALLRPDRAPDPERAGDRPRRAATRSRPATSSAACVAAPSSSAGTRATPRRRPGETAGGSSASGWPRRPIPRERRPSTASARAEDDGTFTIRVAATDIGTGARTVLAQLAADTLEVPLEAVTIEIGDGDFGPAPVAGGSAGTSSWGSAVVKACRRVRAGHREVSVDTEDEAGSAEPLSKHAFVAQFVEVGVDVDSGEVRVDRVLGVFAAGCILNPKTARSQLIGGMTIGVSMALLGESRLDQAFGDYPNHDLAQYHVPVNADLPEIEAVWLEEDDRTSSPSERRGSARSGSSVRPPRSRTPSTTRPASACATCRSRRTSCSPGSRNATSSSRRSSSCYSRCRSGCRGCSGCRSPSRCRARRPRCR